MRYTERANDNCRACAVQELHLLYPTDGSSVFHNAMAVREMAALLKQSFTTALATTERQAAGRHVSR